MTAHPGRYNELSGRSLERLGSLVDAVFAVAMTLLVLDVRLPDVDAATNGELWDAIRGLGPELAAYLLSFTMLGTFWLAEHTLLARCRASDRTLTWAALGFLFFVTTLPFTASVLSSHLHLVLAVLLYWASLAGLGLALAWQVWHIGRAGLLRPGEDLLLVRRRLVLAQLLYAAAAAIAFASTTASLLAFLVTQLFFIVSPRLPWRI